MHSYYFLSGDNLDDASLGGVWLCKQPSLTEGLDSLSSGEDEDDCQEPSESTLPIDETEIKQTGLIRQANEETNLNNMEDHDDVFVDDGDECLEDDTEEASRTEPPPWLVRAISICSEGEDLETLASEADTEELPFPQAFSDYSYCSIEERTNDENELPKNYEGDYPRDVNSDSSENQTESSTQNSSSSSSFVHKSNHGSHRVELVCDKTLPPVDSAAKSEPSESSPGSSVDSKGSLKHSSVAIATEDKQSFTSSSDSGTVVTRQRTISDLGNIYIDPKESDYLYAAGHTIHKALDCEVNGRYEEAFSLYKSCVGLLLSGVQGNSHAVDNNRK